MNKRYLADKLKLPIEKIDSLSGGSNLLDSIEHHYNNLLPQIKILSYSLLELIDNSNSTICFSLSTKSIDTLLEELISKLVSTKSNTPLSIHNYLDFIQPILKIKIRYDFQDEWKDLHVQILTAFKNPNYKISTGILVDQNFINQIPQSDAITQDENLFSISSIYNLPSLTTLFPAKAQIQLLSTADNLFKRFTVNQNVDSFNTTQSQIKRAIMLALKWMQESIHDKQESSKDSVFSDPNRIFNMLQQTINTSNLSSEIKNSNLRALQILNREFQLYQFGKSESTPRTDKELNQLDEEETFNVEVPSQATKNQADTDNLQINETLALPRNMILDAIKLSEIKKSGN